MDTVEEIHGLSVPGLADMDAARAEIRPFIRTTPIFERDDLPASLEPSGQVRTAASRGTSKHADFSSLLALIRRLALPVSPRSRQAIMLSLSPTRRCGWASRPRS